MWVLLITYGDLDELVTALTTRTPGDVTGLSPLQVALGLMIISNDRPKRINALGVLMTLAKKAPPSEAEIDALITKATTKGPGPESSE